MKIRATILIALASTSCKPSTQTEDLRSTGGRRQLQELFATSQSEVRNKGNFYYAIFKKDYELKFDSLPASAAVDDSKIPYVGSWYPQVYGGTNVTTATAPTSALAKYDTVFNGGTNKAAQWEQQNHTVASSDPNSGWRGHCNGFSAAAQRHAEPVKDVVRGSTTFNPKDIKALLAEIHMSAKFYFLGGNRCELANANSLPLPTNRADLLSMSDCEDVNPGTFHVALANWIGVQKHALIFDISTKDQIWNYPHYKYESKGTRVDAAEAMRLITGVSKTPYTFNPSAVSFRSVTTTVYYSEAYSHEVMTSDVSSAQRFKTSAYTYILELDGAGKIVGGEWTGDSIQSHPDFVWVALEPDVGSGAATAANPNLNPAEVIKLWAESINKDPANPPLDVMQPTIPSEWGKFNKFDMAINGVANGTIFLGTTPKVRFTRRDALAGDVSIDLKLDGKAAGSTTASGSDPVVMDLTGGTTGTHLLEIFWKKSGSDADYQRVRVQML